MNTNKKTAVMIIAVFAVITVIMLLLIPVEKKNQRYEDFGQLAVLAETDERADYIIEHYEEYPEHIFKLLEHRYDDDEHIDFIYNYPFHKDDYANMSYTDEELNSDSVPALYMDDKRWGYERIGSWKEIIKTDGCAYVSITMAYLALTHKGDIDPVVLGNYASANKLTSSIGAGLNVKNVSAVCEAIGLKAECHNFDVKHEGTPICSAEEFAEFFGDDKVIIAGMSGETFGGHAIIFRSMDGDKLYINDPADRENTAKEWSFEALKPEIAAIWVVTAQ